MRGLADEVVDAGIDALGKRAIRHPVIVNAYDAWNAMLCDRADAHGFTCVDIYHAFDGPQPERLASGRSTAHPNQAGNDLIAAMLAKVDVSTVRILAEIEQVFVARPTGLGRADAINIRIPIEGAELLRSSESA